MPKYNIDQELAKIAKIKMPDNPALLPLMNRIIGFSKCRSDDTVVVTRHKTPGHGGAILDTLVIEPVHHKGELPCMVLYHGGGFVLKASFARFPPTYIEVAQFDALHDEGVLLYQKLREQEIPAELYEVNGACHGFETATKSNLLKTCMERRIDWLRSALNNVN